MEGNNMLKTKPTFIAFLPLSIDFLSFPSTNLTHHRKQNSSLKDPWYITWVWYSFLVHVTGSDNWILFGWNVPSKIKMAYSTFSGILNLFKVPEIWGRGFEKSIVRNCSEFYQLSLVRTNEAHFMNILKGKTLVLLFNLFDVILHLQLYPFLWWLVLDYNKQLITYLVVQNMVIMGELYLFCIVDIYR